MGPERTTLGDGTILLRPWTLGDVERVAEICADPEIPRWTTVPSPYRREHAVSWIERTIRDWDDREGEASFAIVDAEAGLVIGAIGLRFTDAGGSVGYWVARGARGRGVATRAVEIIRDWRSASSASFSSSWSPIPTTRRRNGSPRRPVSGADDFCVATSRCAASAATSCSSRSTHGR